MAAYSITGTISPDATTAHTGQPAGTYNGQPYWSWTNDAGTWYLWYSTPSGGTWYITDMLGGTEIYEWSKTGSIEIAGTYDVVVGTEGMATVAVIVPGKIRMKMADVTMRREKF